ncbi:MAG: hypothetical protein ACUVV3_03705 [Dehalococcoidia bacterium]
MSVRVRLETRHRSDPTTFQGELEETVILRDDKVIAVLPQGDPLRYGLELSAEELRLLQVNLGPIVKIRPRLREILSALIEYKESQTRELEHPS